MSENESEWPDYTPLKEIVVESEGMLALDFPARVGARPFITYEDSEWSAVSVGPFDSTDDGETIITTKEIGVDGDRVTEMLEDARLVQLCSTQDSPLDGYEDVVYHSLGDVEPVETLTAEDIEDDTDGLHRHTENIKDRFPEPLSLLLIEMAERNREHWLESERWRARTIGAEDVREYGLTENQRRWANQIAEQMGVPHNAYR